MQVDRKCVLLGDIGATNARLALLWDGVLSPVTNFLVADFPRFADVIRAFLVEKCRSAPAQEAILAVAGPVNGGRCVLTNSPWTIDPAELSREFGFTNIDLRNDFEAVALSLPHLTAIDLFRIGYGEPVRGAPIAVLGPGTGLGVAGLVFGPQGPVVVPGEGGHATMSGTCRREDAIIEHLRAEYGHVSAERVVSGMGLENLYSTVVALDGLRAPTRTAPEITKAGLDGTCPISRAALELFCAMLGTIAGNVALMFGALGGVYIAGGIAPRMTDFMAGSEFRSRFENKGRLRSYLEAIPTSVIVNPAATFVGLQTIAQSTPGTVRPGGTPEP